MLLALALLVAFLLRPPLLGWVGFAVMCAIVLGLATVATIAVPRMRVNPQRPAVALDHEPRLLVVADEHCGSPALWQEIYARLGGALTVHLVVPVRVSHLHYLTNDEREESRHAEDRARLADTPRREPLAGARPDALALPPQANHKVDLAAPRQDGAEPGFRRDHAAPLHPL